MFDNSPIKNYFGIDINKVNGVINMGTWDRTSHGNPVRVTCLTAIEGDPEEHYKKYYPKTVSAIVGELKDAILPIDQPQN